MTLKMSFATTAGAFAFLAAAGLSGPANAAQGTVNVTCTSQGEACDQYGVIAYGTPGMTIPISLTAPKTHCSNIIYMLKYERHTHPFRTLGTLATTRSLAPGEGQAFTIVLPATPLRIYAQGVPGGCNTGRVASWSVNWYIGVYDPGGLH